MDPDRHDVSGATIVVTGASSGIGRGVALALAAQGANLVLAARRTELIDELAAAIVDAGGNAIAVTTDVADAAAVARLADAAIARFGWIDVWINNVGVGAFGLFWEVPIEDHARLVDVNLGGVIHGAHEALRRFRVQGYGTLLNVGSTNSELPVAYMASYCASKAAVLSLGRSLNAELRLAGHTNIRVGTILPFAADTPWWTHAANYAGHAPLAAGIDRPAAVIATIVDACSAPRREQPASAKARATTLSHRLFPGLTERVSGRIVDAGMRHGDPLPPTSGALHHPMDDPGRIEGGLRARRPTADAGSGGPAGDRRST